MDEVWVSIPIRNHCNVCFAFAFSSTIVLHILFFLYIFRSFLSLPFWFLSDAMNQCTTDKSLHISYIFLSVQVFMCFHFYD